MKVRSSEDEGVIGGERFPGLSQPYLGSRWFLAQKKNTIKKEGVSDARWDPICSHNVYNQKGQPVSVKKVLKRWTYSLKGGFRRADIRAAALPDSGRIPLYTRVRQPSGLPHLQQHSAKQD